MVTSVSSDGLLVLLQGVQRETAKDVAKELNPVALLTELLLIHLGAVLLEHVDRLLVTRSVR